MGTQLGAFPDAETVMMTLLEPIAPTVTSTPAELNVPITRVQLVGGSDDGITDRPRMEVPCYGADRAKAWQLAERRRQVVLGSVRSEVATETARVLIDNAVPTTYPGAVRDQRGRAAGDRLLRVRLAAASLVFDAPWNPRVVDRPERVYLGGDFVLGHFGRDDRGTVSQVDLYVEEHRRLRWFKISDIHLELVE